MCKKDFMKSQVVASLKGVRLGDNRKDLSLPLGADYPKESKTEVSVKANEELRYVMGYDNQSVYIATEYVQGYTGSSSCLIAKTFTPKENHIYEITYELEGNKCISNIFDIVNKSGDYVREVYSASKFVECKKL